MGPYRVLTSWSTLVQIMSFACSTLIHWLNWSWHIVKWIHTNKFDKDTAILIQENVYENVILKMPTILFNPTNVNSLWPSDAIWWQRSGSTLAQVMACCLTAPSHYLNQCWLIISKVLWHSSEGIIMKRSEDTNQQNKIENYIFRIAFRSPRGQWVK